MNDETERAKFLQEMINIIDPTIDTDTGHSGDWIYGNYIEWQPLENLEDVVIDDLCEHFSIDTKLSMEGKYTLLREKNVPENTTMYEFDVDYPDSAKYWKSEFDEYEYYTEHNLKYENYNNQIDEIMGLVKNNTNDLIKKSLLLSSFILTESFIKSKIINKISDLKNLNNELTKKLFEEYVENDLRNSDKRRKIFKIMFNGQILNDNQVFELRHSLAHDIGRAYILNNKIYFIGNNEKSKSADIQIVFEELKKFVERLNQIQ